MSILKWKDFDEMLSIRDEVDRLFDRMFENTKFHSWEERYALMSSGESAPEFNVYPGEESTAIRVSLPGFQKGDIKVSVSGNLLAVGSEVNREREFRGNGAYRYQRSHGGFCKVMELPAGVDVNNIKASFNDGVLEVVLPKAKPGITDETTIPINMNLSLSSEILPDEIDKT